MKKAQILSALALAFALGVAVIPSASTYAYVVDSEDKTITASATLTALNDAITEAQKTKTAAEFQKYEPLVKAINGDLSVTPDGGTAATLNDTKDDQQDDLLTALGGVSGFDSNVWKNKSYEEVLAQAKTQRDAAKDLDGGTSTLYNDLKSAVDNAEEAVQSYEIATIAKIQDILATSFDYKGTYLTTNFVKTENGKTTVDFAGAAAYAKNQAPQYAFYTNLVSALNKAQDVIKAEAAGGEKYTEAQAVAALNALNAAIEGKTVPGEGDGNQGEGSNKPDQNAPDTGILANAEGSASTTVAMVAGIATALTAAGAGVVAYRNARRSSRK